MHEVAQRRARAWAARGILIVGAAATIATSRAVDPRLSAAAEATLEPDVAQHVVVRISRSALQHEAQLEVAVRASPPSGAAILISPDDVSVATSSISSGDSNLARIFFGTARDLCPGEETCDVGLELRLDEGAEESATASIEASLVRGSDSRFLFPENRSFGEGDTIEVVGE